jgi:hypothetical protein
MCSMTHFDTVQLSQSTRPEARTLRTDTGKPRSAHSTGQVCRELMSQLNAEPLLASRYPLPGGDSCPRRQLPGGHGSPAWPFGNGCRPGEAVIPSVSQAESGGHGLPGIPTPAKSNDWAAKGSTFPPALTIHALIWAAFKGGMTSLPSYRAACYAGVQRRRRKGGGARRL